MDLSVMPVGREGMPENQTQTRPMSKLQPASPTALRGETPFGCQAVTIRAEAISPADGKLDLQ